jgi:hypothetical protein
VIELYAVTRHPGPPLPPLPELAPLRAVAAGDGLAAVCAPAGDEEVTPEALWRFEQVVEALMEDRDVLPVRYGTRFDDEAAAARAVEDREADLAAALDRVHGAVELSVRVIAVGERAPDVHAPLSKLARATVRRSDTSELLRAAYLVDRDAVGRFADLVARLQASNPDLRLLCTGPWPPYSFAGP